MPRTPRARISAALAVVFVTFVVLGLVGDPFGNSQSEVPSVDDGIVIGSSSLPLVHEGEALFHIARFEDTGEVVGVALYEGNRKAFFQEADRALYRAKALGKNCVVTAGDASGDETPF